jgi:hypothetical protein
MGYTVLDNQRNADRNFKATDMVEGTQEYQQIGENLWKE